MKRVIERHMSGQNCQITPLVHYFCMDNLNGQALTQWIQSLYKVAIPNQITYSCWKFKSEDISCHIVGACILYRRACGFQNLVGTTVYGGHNLLPSGCNRVKMAAKTYSGHVPMFTCPQAHLQWSTGNKLVHQTDQKARKLSNSSTKPKDRLSWSITEY